MRPRRNAPALFAALAALMLPAGALAAVVTTKGSVESIKPAGSVERIDRKASVLSIDLAGSTIPVKITHHVGRSTQVTLSADVLFAFNSAKLSGPAKGALAGVAANIKGHPRIKVDGYTDAVGSARYNLKLSQRRAQAVAAELRGKGKISAAGHGEANPVAPNKNGKKDDPAGRAKNRRVTITYR